MRARQSREWVRSTTSRRSWRRKLTIWRTSRRGWRMSRTNRRQRKRWISVALLSILISGRNSLIVYFSVQNISSWDDIIQNRLLPGSLVDLFAFMYLIFYVECFGCFIPVCTSAHLSVCMYVCFYHSQSGNSFYKLMLFVLRNPTLNKDYYIILPSHIGHLISITWYQQTFEKPKILKSDILTYSPTSFADSECLLTQNDVFSIATLKLA